VAQVVLQHIIGLSSGGWQADLLKTWVGETHVAYALIPSHIAGSYSTLHSRPHLNVEIVCCFLTAPQHEVFKDSVLQRIKGLFTNNGQESLLRASFFRGSLPRLPGIPSQAGIISFLNTV